MSYILSEKPRDCVLCELAAAELSPESLVLHATDAAFVMLNRYPFTNGHLMVVPNAHVPAMTGLDEKSFLATATLLRQSVAIIERCLRPAGLNVGLNQGQAGGAGIAEHMHFHIVPRWVGDTNYVSVIGKTRVINQSLEDTWQELRPHFAAL